MMVKSKAVFDSNFFIFNGFDGFPFRPFGLISMGEHPWTGGSVLGVRVFEDTHTRRTPPSHSRDIGGYFRQPDP
jgi:hypothetical protein